MKEIITIRGFPGSGRTTLAKRIADGGEVISIEDFLPPFQGDRDFFETNDMAHAYTDMLGVVAEKVAAGKERIIVDMHGIRLWELRDVMRIGESAGYSFAVTSPATPWASDVHRCAEMSKTFCSPHTWAHLVKSWQHDPTPERIRESVSPLERLQLARWYAAMGDYDTKALRKLEVDYPDEMIQLATTGMLGPNGLLRRRAFIKQMALEGLGQPKLIDAPALTVAIDEPAPEDPNRGPRKSRGMEMD